MLCGFRPVWLRYPVGALQTVDWPCPLPSLGTTGQLAYFTRVPGGSSQPRFHWICALAERQIDIELVLRWLLRLAVRDGWLFSYDWHLIYLRWPKCMGSMSEDLRIFVTTVTVTAVTKRTKMKFYNRTNELAELRRIQKLSFSDHSRCSAIWWNWLRNKHSMALSKLRDNAIERIIFFFRWLFQFNS